jgi:transcription antitermination factor NusG
MSFDGKSPWLVLMVKDKFARDCDREKIKSQLIKLFGLAIDDVFYVPFAQNNPYSYYVFVKERNSSENLLSRIFGTPIGDFLAGYKNCKVRITPDEFRRVVRTSKVAPNSDIRFGDFVKIKEGTYSNLYGIVLRESTRKDKVFVGLKFCFGVVVIEYHTGQLETIGNLFNYIKVLK